MTWMLYGANGYTGELMAAEAKRRNMKPVLAGRREEAIRPIAERLGLAWRVFPLDDVERIARELDGVDAVLLAAGPFSHTSRPMVDACLRAKKHYLDITGEIGVFEACHARDAEAKARGVVIMPGVGFDVVPSDCLAASLKEALPTATSLELAFAGVMSPSKGTAKTMVEGLREGGAIREGGHIRRVPFAYKRATVAFRDKPRHVMSIPWGDVSTAFYSTGIPDIVVYMAASPNARFARPLMPLLATRPAQRLLTALVERRVKGPDQHTRQTARSHLWGRVTAPGGRTAEATLETPEGYALTVLTGLAIVERLLAGKIDSRAGALTPSRGFGARFITEIPGCDLQLR